MENIHDIALQDCPLCRGTGALEEEGGWLVYVQCLDCGCRTVEMAYHSEEERREMLAQFGLSVNIPRMQDDLRRMEFVPGNFYNFHPGSHVGQGTEEGIRKIAETLDLAMFEGQTTIVLLETMAGKGTEVGGRFEELRAIIDRTAMQEKLGVCLDTCHVSDAGYDIAGNLEAVLEEFDRVIGLPRLRALHLNDSKNPLASHKDRHERLGEGYLGIETFYHIIEHPALRGLPMILETPNELPGYAAEIARLRAYDAANANKL